MQALTVFKSQEHYYLSHPLLMETYTTSLIQWIMYNTPAAKAQDSVKQEHNSSGCSQ